MATRKAQPKDEASAEVQKQVDKEEEQGFRGVEVDPTPNHAYSVEGVVAGEPTPETDRDAAERAAAAHRRGF